MKTTWNFELLYKNDKDPQIERDIVAYEKACESFEKKYRTQTEFLTEETKLREALKDYETLFAMVEPRRALNYFYYRKELNSMDQLAEQKINIFSDRLTKAGNKVLFFDLALGNIKPED